MLYVEMHNVMDMKRSIGRASITFERKYNFGVRPIRVWGIQHLEQLKSFHTLNRELAQFHKGDAKPKTGPQGPLAIQIARYEASSREVHFLR